ncbi:MAG: membrane dipeptidase [Anaerolineales bacterium]|nr:membrane dipeptidase [Anaerolineales bacterium]
MHIIIDAHEDLAYNMLKHGRDYARSVAETRALEAGSRVAQYGGDTLLGWQEYQRGNVAVVFSTLYATPARFKSYEGEPLVYQTFDEARSLYSQQLDLYHRMQDSAPDKFRILASKHDLELHLDQRADSAPEAPKPLGMVILMEGAEGIRSPDELEEWHKRGLRLIGLAWVGTRYCGGWREPGPLTDDGRKLLSAMAEFNFTLDLSHMDERSALEALDFYPGPIVGTHANCAALMPDSNSNRHFTDAVIEGVIQRDGVVGVIPFNAYLKADWRANQSRREDVPLEVLINHIDHICQLAGDSLHVGVGSDFDGGFGVQSVPPEIDSIADLQKIGDALQARGYSDADAANVLGGNWLARLQRDLP